MTVIRRKRFVIIALAILGLISLSPDSGLLNADVLSAAERDEACQQCQPCSPEGETEYPIMRPSPDQKSRWTEDYRRAPAVQISRSLQRQVGRSFAGSNDLLSHLQYTPAERNQGSCANCWAWVGTGVMEVALSVQNGIKDRLSIQYLNSNYNGGSGDWACCGGWLEYLTDFYAGTGMAIPWSNDNASYADGGRTCSGSTSMPAASISTTTNYPVTSITVQTIQTYGVLQDTAIENIKNIIDQNKAVWFGFFLADGSDWSNFGNFWNGQAEDIVWNPNFTCGKQYNYTTGGGHAVLCVGYNDDNPANRYWIMVNSWGTRPGRPNGIFRLDMNMNYSCSHTGPGGGQAFFWETLDITFVGTRPNPPSNLTATAVPSGQIDLSWQDNSTDETGFKIERKTATGGIYTQTATVGADVNSYNDTGLSASTAYRYRVRASSAGGDSSYSNEAQATTPIRLYPIVEGSYRTRSTVRFYDWKCKRWAVVPGGTLHITEQDRHKVTGYWEPPAGAGLGWSDNISVKGYVGLFVRDARGNIRNTTRLSLLAEYGEYCTYPGSSYAAYVINATVRVDRRTGMARLIYGAIQGWGEFGPPLADGSPSLGQLEGWLTAMPLVP